MNSAPERLPIPQSPDELWAQVVLPHVEEELVRIARRFPDALLPDFYNSYLLIAQQNFQQAVERKRNFKKWADEIKDWKGWAHGLIPYEKINHPYVRSIFEKLCCVKPGATRPSGLAPDTVRKVMAANRPNDMSYDEFFNTVLQETGANFMKRYFSSFREPMESWLYELTESSAMDFVKKWVEGMRLAEEHRPKGFDSLDEPRKGPEGEPREPHKDTLTDREDRAVKKAKALAQKLRSIHVEEGESAQLSDVVIELFYGWGFTELEIAKQRALSPREVKKILKHDCGRMAIIARQLGIRHRTGKQQSGAAEAEQ